MTVRSFFLTGSLFTRRIRKNNGQSSNWLQLCLPAASTKSVIYESYVTHDGLLSTFPHSISLFSLYKQNVAAAVPTRFHWHVSCDVSSWQKNM